MLPTQWSGLSPRPGPSGCGHQALFTWAQGVPIRHLRVSAKLLQGPIYTKSEDDLLREIQIMSILNPIARLRARAELLADLAAVAVEVAVAAATPHGPFTWLY